MKGLEGEGRGVKDTWWGDGSVGRGGEGVKRWEVDGVDGVGEGRRRSMREWRAAVCVILTMPGRLGRGVMSRPCAGNGVVGVSVSE